jgi:hypothetical protein
VRSVLEETADQAQGRADAANLAIVQAPETAIAGSQQILAEIATRRHRVSGI